MKRIECLDGLRGLAALWVLIGHCMLLTGFYFPILSKPDLGVDLFILLSGFLMVFQYNLRKEEEQWEKPAAWAAFWVRRFFRLSSLYFCLLVVALLLGKAIYADRVLIDTFLGYQLQRPERYTDASATNFLTHFTYLFGLIPSYAFRTPLPDWSLGLEMQFYAIFPFTVLMARKIGWLSTAICVAFASITIAIVVSRFGISFPMPSFLPLKMHIFLAGMLICAAIGKNKIPYLVLCLLLVAIPIGGDQDILHFFLRELIMISFFVLVHCYKLPWINRASSLLGSPVFHWLGELSFGVYLIHLLIMHRVAAWTIIQWGGDIPQFARFAISFVIVAPITYGIAYVTYMCIERPGQRLGKNLLKAVGKRKQAMETPAENIAAP